MLVNEISLSFRLSGGYLNLEHSNPSDLYWVAIRTNDGGTVTQTGYHTLREALTHYAKYLPPENEKDAIK